VCVSLRMAFANHTYDVCVFVCVCVYVCVCLWGLSVYCTGTPVSNVCVCLF